MNNQASILTDAATVVEDPEMQIIALFNSGAISEAEAINRLMEMEFDYFEAEDFVANRGNV